MSVSDSTRRVSCRRLVSGLCVAALLPVGLLAAQPAAAATSTVALSPSVITTLSADYFDVFSISPSATSVTINLPAEAAAVGAATGRFAVDGLVASEDTRYTLAVGEFDPLLPVTLAFSANGYTDIRIYLGSGSAGDSNFSFNLKFADSPSGPANVVANLTQSNAAREGGGNAWSLWTTTEMIPSPSRPAVTWGDTVRVVAPTGFWTTGPTGTWPSTVIDARFAPIPWTAQEMPYFYPYYSSGLSTAVSADGSTLTVTLPRNITELYESYLRLPDSWYIPDDRRLLTRSEFAAKWSAQTEILLDLDYRHPVEKESGRVTLDLDWANAAGTPNERPTTDRIAGPDRYATAIEVSKKFAADVPVVYVATGTAFPDALSAAPAAAAQGGPVLLVQPTSLPAAVKDEIIRLNPGEIVVAGGTSAVSQAVYDELADLGKPIRRDSGSDRFATSRAIVTAAFPTASAAFVATGNNFADALSASAAAGKIGAPVILVNGQETTVDDPSKALIDQLGVTVITIAGGTTVVSSQVATQLAAIPGVSSVTRIGGDDRYQTSGLINRANFTTSDRVYLATGTGFADALAGAALAGRDGAPLYVVPSTCVPAYVIDDIAAFGTTKVTLLGGGAALTTDVDALVQC